MRSASRWVVVGAVAGIGWAGGAASAAIILNDSPPPSDFGRAVVIESTQSDAPSPPADATSSPTWRGPVAVPAPTPRQLQGIDGADSPGASYLSAVSPA